MKNLGKVNNNSGEKQWQVRKNVVITKVHLLLDLGKQDLKTLIKFNGRKIFLKMKYLDVLASTSLHRMRRYNGDSHLTITVTQIAQIKKGKKRLRCPSTSK